MQLLFEALIVLMMLTCLLYRQKAGQVCCTENYLFLCNGIYHLCIESQVYTSVKDSPIYPEGFRAVQNGFTKNRVKNTTLLAKLREIESGDWKKVYEDGYDKCGNKVSIHYYVSKSGRVTLVKLKDYWSNLE